MALTKYHNWITRCRISLLYSGSKSSQVKYILKSDGIYSIVTQAPRSFSCRLSSIIKISQIVQDKKVSNNVTKARKNYNHKARKNNNHKARKNNNYRGAYIYDRKV